MNCPICDSVDAKKRFAIQGDHSIYRCRNCHAEFLSSQLSDAELEHLYSETYYAAWGISGETENDITRKMKMATFQLRLDTIRKFSNIGSDSATQGTSPKILDVGCATGYFLELARQQAYEPYGVEFSGYSATIAKKKFGEDRIFQGKLEQAPFPKSDFQVIAMSDLIEHVRLPQQTLSKASSLLAKDGLILIMTPDTGTLSNKIMGRRWTHYKLEHFFYFSRYAMDYLARKCDLQVLHYERSKKALNIDYLHTQLNVYRHWLLTPLINLLHRMLPEGLTTRNFYFSIGEMVVLLSKVELIAPAVPL